MHKSYKKSLKKQSLKKKSLQKKHKNTKKRALAKKQIGGARSARSARSSNIIMSSFSVNNMNNNHIKEYYKTLTPEELQNELNNIKNEFVKLRNVPHLTNNSIISKIDSLKRKFKIIQEIIVSE
jgi:hypothetical protein